MSRFDFFMETYAPSKILDIYNDTDFTEITIRDGGDVIAYRIYGDAKTGFKVSVR